MTQSLFDQGGARKYLIAKERRSFVSAAVTEGGRVGAFCLTLAFTGARISEVLALTSRRIDKSNCAIVFETLKQRKRAVFRAIPVPSQLLAILARDQDFSELQRIPLRLSRDFSLSGKRGFWKRTRTNFLAHIGYAT